MFVWQVATFILQKILLDDTGLAYICQTYERFSHVAMILVSALIRNQLTSAFLVFSAVWHQLKKKVLSVCLYIFNVSLCRAKWCCSSPRNHQHVCWSMLFAATFASQTISGRAIFGWWVVLYLVEIVTVPSNCNIKKKKKRLLSSSVGATRRSCEPCHWNSVLVKWLCQSVVGT